jgi:copper chaperone NosL
MKIFSLISFIIFFIAVGLLVGVKLLPIWKITLTAPQYPMGINMYISIDKIGGDEESTLQNINILNHYVGMKFIEPDSIPELKYFPYVIYSMLILGLIFLVVRLRILKLIWVSLIIILGILGVYDFYMWEYDYGHNLSPDAPIKVEGMSYQPPLIGAKMLLNFKAESYPHYGSMFLGSSVLLAFVSYLIQRKHEKKYKNFVSDTGSSPGGVLG